MRDRRDGVRRDRFDAREPAAARLSAALHASPGVSEQDAQAAIAAAAHRVPLVTEDRDLRAATALHLADVPLWTWAQLRPRIEQLADEHARETSGRPAR